MRAGNTEQGYARLERALFATRTTGSRAAHSNATSRTSTKRTARALDWLRASLPKLATTELDETVRYALALHLEEAGDLEGARDVFVTTAPAHPYPHGALFDDALWHASLLDEKLGRPAQAIADLERMLAVREASTYDRELRTPALLAGAIPHRGPVPRCAGRSGRSPRARSTRSTPITQHRSCATTRSGKRRSWPTTTAKPDAACTLAATLAEEFPTRATPRARGPLLRPHPPASVARCHAIHS